MLANNQHFKECCKLLEELRVISLRINKILKQLDPDFHATLERLRLALCAQFPYYRLLAASDPLLLLGRSIIFNRATPEHLDLRDAIAGWAVLLAFGHFHGGELYVPHLGRVFSFPPGTLVLIRGALFSHRILPFFGGVRVSMAHFVHESVFRYFNMSSNL